MTTKEIATYIDIDGKEYPHIVSLKIRQAFYAHNEFELVLNQDALAASNVGIRATQDFIGKFVAIAFGELEAGDQFFRGIVTEASFRQTQGEWVQMELKGYSTTYLMEGGNHSASYTEKTLKNIVEECTANLAGNDLNLMVNPYFVGEITYKCQYGESHFEFLTRLAKEYGEWCYSNGREFYFGRPSSSPTAKLIQGRNLHKVRLSLRLLANKSVHTAYDREQDEVLKTEAQGDTGQSDEFCTASSDKADKLYRFAMQQRGSAPIKGKAALDSEAKLEKGRRAASLVLLSAEGDSPKVGIGSKVEVAFEQHDLSNMLVQEKGEYLVTSIEHTISGTGAYTNSFEAISGKSDYIPCDWSKPSAEAQPALVKDNADPQGWGRVRVQMPWQKGRMTDWIWCLVPDAGSSAITSKNRGYVFVPEVGDRVMVGFEQDDPDRPFVLGSIFHGKNAAGGGNGNNLKSIITRSGHTIAFDDTDGGESITITDKKNNIITLDTATSSITISAPDNISITAKNIDISAKENISITAGTDISASAKENISQSAGENLTQRAGEDATLAAKNISSQSTEKMMLSAKEMESTAKEVKVNSTQKDMVLASGKKVNMQSGEKIKLF